MIDLIYSIIVSILIIIYTVSPNMNYKDPKRTSIIVLIYPLLIYNVYQLSLKIHETSSLNLQIFTYIFTIILCSLTINYLQQPRLTFDPDDERKEALIIISSLLLLENVIIILYQILPTHIKNKILRIAI
tara:strand:- start:131 stop:520 length:390 start_codon:yes stop_codon:yes gene_type:complete